LPYFLPRSYGGLVNSKLSLDKLGIVKNLLNNPPKNPSRGILIQNITDTFIASSVYQSALILADDWFSDPACGGRVVQDPVYLRRTGLDVSSGGGPISSSF